MIREALSSVARNESLGGLLSRTPVTRGVVKRVVGGDTLDEALTVAADLADRGLWVSLERAAPTVESEDAADAVLTEYLTLADRLALAGLAGVCEISAFPESLGTDRADGVMATRDRLATLCEHASSVGVSVMVGMGPADHVGRTLEWADDLQGRGLDVGVTVQAALRRSEEDCRHFAGQRVRLVKGAHRGDRGVSHEQPAEIDKAFVRCAKTLLGGDGSPSFATHDPVLVAVLESLVRRYLRDQRSYEFAFYMGRMEGVQERLAAEGDRVRVYAPYGPDWFERLVGGLAEQPTSIVAAIWSLLPGSPT
ncbi:MAG: proline dehydrogenase family protein [Actinobacteria bacterium]|nr:proline dehydrogenase family protein [Actinomycetota bacterium]